MRGREGERNGEREGWKKGKRHSYIKEKWGSVFTHGVLKGCRTRTGVVEEWNHCTTCMPKGHRIPSVCAHDKRMPVRTLASAEWLKHGLKKPQQCLKSLCEKPKLICYLPVILDTTITHMQTQAVFHDFTVSIKNRDALFMTSSLPHNTLC